MKYIFILVIAQIFFQSCQDKNESELYYENVKKIYADFNIIYWDYMQQKDTSACSISERMTERMEELKALPVADGGELLKEKMLSDMLIWQQTFELSCKIEQPGLSAPEKALLINERINFQMRRNPARDSMNMEMGNFYKKIHG